MKSAKFPLYKITSLVFYPRSNVCLYTKLIEVAPEIFCSKPMMIDELCWRARVVND